MSEQKFRVGQKVRVVDVQEGVVTEVGSGRIRVDGQVRCISGTNGTMTRTITILSEPKPDEPTGLWAVVLDRGGEAWSRIPAYGGLNHWAKISGIARWLTWDELDAVDVLFPGVEQ